MNLNTYLPDDLGQRAKDAGLNLSALLRAAVIKELHMIDTMKALAEGVERIEITICGRDDISRDYAFNGRWLTEGVDDFGPMAAITARGNILVVWLNRGDIVDYKVYKDFAALKADVVGPGSQEFLADVSEALGRPYVIEWDI